MKSNKDSPVNRAVGDEGKMSSWEEFWVTIRWALVIGGIVGTIFIMSKCDASVLEPSSPLDRCFNTCDNSYSGDKEIECLSKCKDLFGNYLNQTKEGSDKIGG